MSAKSNAALKRVEVSDTAAPAPALREIAGLDTAAKPARTLTPAFARRGPRVPLEVFNAVIRGVDISAAILVCVVTLHLTGATVLGSTLGALLPYFALATGLLLTLSTVRAWQIDQRMIGADHWLRLANATGAAMAVGGLYFTLTMGRADALHLTRLAFWLWFVTCMLHAVYGAIGTALLRKGNLSENVVIVGATENARKLIARNAETQELNIVGVFDDRLARAPDEINGVPVLGTMDDLMGWDQLPRMDRIVVTVTSDARDRVRAMVDRLRVLPQRVVLLLDLDGFNPETESLSQIARSPAAYVSGRPQDLRRAIVKRATDIVLSIALMVIFLPLIATTALAIRLEGKGPILFRQRRHGFNNQVIRVWKFRSMKPDAGAEVRMAAQTFAGDPRVTRVGKFIRATSIDELPQLINVLKGEMSLVGPRPHALGMTAEQTEVHDIVSDYAHRHRVKPGLTGWAQINGSRGPVHSKNEVRDRVRFDMEYVNRSSFWFDLYIIAMTAPCLLGDRMAQR